MSARFVQIVNCCRECPERIYLSDGRSDCMETRRTIQNIDAMPDWCPLQHRPAEAEELRARVAELERANVSLAEEAQRMKSALRFYAHQQHVIDFHGELVEGWLNQTDRTKEAIVEPGRYALWALLGKRIDWEGEEPPEHPEELRMIGA